jgi:hypothetical protein
MERKSTGRAGQEQRLEDMLNTDERIERIERKSTSTGESWTGAETGRYFGGRVRESRDWKICIGYG